MLAIQMMALSLVGSAFLLFKTSAATRVWCIRLLVVACLGLACASQIPVSVQLPPNRSVMLPVAMEPVHGGNNQLHKVFVEPSSRELREEEIVSISALEVWAVGWLAGLIMVSVASIKLRRLRRGSQPLGAYQGLQVRISTCVGSPLVAGLFRPTLYMPTGMPETLSEEELASIYAHEAAHVSHRDLWWKTAHQLSCILLWPNVVLWLLVAQHNRAMEELADARASLAANSPENYAALLLKIVKLRKGRDVDFALAMTPRRSNSGRRVRKVLDGEPGKQLSLFGRKARLGIVGVILCSLVFVPAGFGWQKAQNDAAKYPWQKLSGELTVRILGPDGKPAVNPQAWLHLGAGIHPYDPIAVTDGTVHIDRSRYSALDALQIVARDSAGNADLLEVKNGASAIDMSLQPLAIAKGRMVLDGKPVAGLRIDSGIAFGNKTWWLDGPLAAHAVTDANGYFQLAGNPRGSTIQFTVDDPMVQRPNRRNPMKGGGESFGFKIEDGPVTDFGDIALKTAGQITGRVTADGHGVSGITVVAQSQNGNVGASEGGQAITGADGRYSIGGLGRAQYNVELYLPPELSAQYAGAAKEGVFPQTGKTVEEDFKLNQGGVIEGKVILKGLVDPDGYPVAYYGPDHPQSSAACGFTRCDANGHFSIRVSPGSHYVYLQCATVDQANVTVTVSDGQTVHVALKE